ncbi:MAG: bacterial proteasome activator family protein [Candidatus Nanopelagicales bacterium]
MTESSTSTDDAAPQRIVVVGPDGQPVGEMTMPSGDESGDGETSITDLVEQPGKVMRIGTMIKQLLEEVRSAPLDEAGRARLKEIHRRSIAELEQGLAPELVSELERVSLPFTEEGVPSEAELRIAQAQLVGWLEGLFHGIQTALFAQQVSARAQFEEMRRRAALPPGAGPTDQGPPQPEAQPQPHSTGPYL